jgi:hypothetical protein
MEKWFTVADKSEQARLVVIHKIGDHCPKMIPLHVHGLEVAARLQLGLRTVNAAEIANVGYVHDDHGRKFVGLKGLAYLVNDRIGHENLVLGGWGQLLGPMRSQRHMLVGGKAFQVIPSLRAGVEN